MQTVLYIFQITHIITHVIACSNNDVYISITGRVETGSVSLEVGIPNNDFTFNDTVIVSKYNGKMK